LLNAGLSQCDVLKVAHHGSQYSSTPAFLNAVQPKIALISVGVGNTYHHPGPDTVERIRSMGTAIYRTDESGQITVTSTGHGVKVTTAHAPVAVPGTPAPWYPSGTAPAATAAVPAPPPTASTPVPGAATAVTAAPAASTSATPDPACAYVASKSSEVFHENSCGNGGKISPDNKICYSTREAAIASGRRPAGCCKP
jgi:competence protein ComEC